MIPEAKVSEIRERSSIVEVISDHLRLKKAGRNFLGLCPFHSEKTPSFTVNEEKGIFHCFGCGEGGNVFHFLMRHGNLSFPEAVESVARRYGIPVVRSDLPRERARSEERETFYRLNERAAAFFHQSLFAHPEGRRAIEYLKKRGVDERSSRRFYLGYAPQAGAALAGFLQREGLPLFLAARLGLLSEAGANRYRDKFAGRLIFPIVDAGGKFVGFGGRVLGDGLPKYLNSADSTVFHKGATLYGLYQAKESVRALDRVVVVEGYLDVVALSQFGFGCAVATLGTALTPDHIRILGRYTKNVVALFDGDEAGRKAGARSFEIFLDGGLLGRAAFLPKGEDPDSFIRAKGKDALDKIVSQAVPLADYYFAWLEQQHGKSLEGKSAIAKDIARALGKVRNPFEVDLLVRRASDSLGIREDLLRSSIPMGPRGGGISVRSGRNRTPSLAGEDLAERSLIGLMLRFPSVMEQMASQADLDQLLSAGWLAVVRRMLQVWREAGSVEVGEVAQGLSREQGAQAAAAYMEAEQFPEPESARMMEDCLSHLRRRYLRGLERELREAIRIAEDRKDEKLKKERMREWQEVVKRERQIASRKLASKPEIQ